MNSRDPALPDQRQLAEPASDLDVLAHRVIGAAIEVHGLLGPGFLESAYEEALGVELTLRGLPFARQVPVSIDYKGYPVAEGRLDFLVDERLVLELKVVEAIAPIHVAQLLSYLKITQLRLGLLITFNVPILRRGIKRVIYTP